VKRVKRGNSERQGELTGFQQFADNSGNPLDLSCCIQILSTITLPGSRGEPAERVTDQLLLKEKRSKNCEGGALDVEGTLICLKGEK